VIPVRAADALFGWGLTTSSSSSLAQTQGALLVAELTARPEFAPPPHIHQHEDESYYVLNGEFEFMSGGRLFRAGTGSFGHLPRGELHLHRAVAGAAKALVLVTPAGVEKFIAEAGNAAADPSAVPAVPDMPAVERILSIARNYGIEVPAPPEM
jgi:quercetin dioxygenase-like cupin family protein